MRGLQIHPTPLLGHVKRPTEHEICPSGLAPHKVSLTPQRVLQVPELPLHLPVDEPFVQREAGEHEDGTDEEGASSCERVHHELQGTDEAYGRAGETRQFFIVDPIILPVDSRGSESALLVVGLDHVSHYGR